MRTGKYTKKYRTETQRMALQQEFKQSLKKNEVTGKDFARAEPLMERLKSRITLSRTSIERKEL